MYWCVVLDGVYLGNAGLCLVLVGVCLLVTGLALACGGAGLPLIGVRLLWYFGSEWLRLRLLVIWLPGVENCCWAFKLALNLSSKSSVSGVSDESSAIDWGRRPFLVLESVKIHTHKVAILTDLHLHRFLASLPQYLNVVQRRVCPTSLCQLLLVYPTTLVSEHSRNWCPAKYMFLMNLNPCLYLFRVMDSCRSRVPRYYWPSLNADTKLKYSLNNQS